MNKINPFYILIFSVLLFLYSIFDLNVSKNNLQEVKEENKQYMKIAYKYKTLQKAWGKNSNTKSKIENILKLSNIRNANIITTNKIIKIKINNTSTKALDIFMNKILNETIVISSFSLTKSTLNLEVEL